MSLDLQCCAQALCLGSPIYTCFQRSSVCLCLCHSSVRFQHITGRQQVSRPVAYLDAAARYKREAERLRVQEDLAETERKRNELRGLLAMYSNE